MKKLLVFVCVGVLGFVSGAATQDLVVTNTRIIVGTGQVIESGSIVVRGGRIASLAVGSSPAPDVMVVVDGSGFTAVAGFIDGHRHIYSGKDADAWLRNQAPTQMREFLEAGYTTLVSGGGPAEPIVELKRLIDSGQMVGPRVVPSAPLAVNAKTTADSVREDIRKIAAMGIKFTGEVLVNLLTSDPDQHTLEMLSAAADEGKKHGVMVAVHATSIPAMLATVKAGVPRLVHTPHFQWMTDADAKIVSDAGVQVLSCVGFGAPVFGVFNRDNTPTFRDGGKWPEALIGGQGRAREAGYKPVNGRTLFDNGVVYGYATDTNYLPVSGLSQELRVLNLMFSPVDMVKVMGSNTASWIGMSTDIGTLEVGKLADIVLLGDNPLDGYWNFLEARVVIKGGVVLVDKR